MQTVGGIARAARQGLCLVVLLGASLVVGCTVSRDGLKDPDLPERAGTSATIETQIRPSDGATMVRVPAGEFVMGSMASHVAELEGACADCPAGWFDAETPQSAVRLNAYWIDKYEVTNRQYRAFIQGGGYDQRYLWTEAGWDWKEQVSREEPRYWGESPWGDAELPVVGVAWYEALAYCRWAGARLPTEAEWEKAAGWDPDASRKLKYPWGEQWDSELANTAESGIGGTTKPGRFCPGGASPIGACDMAGNAWEWCSSLHQPYPYRADDGREDLESDKTRALRGGSWINRRERARTTYRLPPFPGDFIMFDPTNGFRCAASDD